MGEASQKVGDLTQSDLLNTGWYVSTSHRLCKDETIQVLLVTFNKSMDYSNLMGW